MGGQTVTLHSSWRGIFAGSVGSSALLLAGTVVVARVGWGVIPTITLMLGAVLLTIVMFDYPIASSFDTNGVTRRMALRRQRLEWECVDHLSRTRPGLVSGFRKLAHGGLVAVVGRRRYLLNDRCESLEEYEWVRRALGERAHDLMATTPEPPPGTVPTWWYRRRKWAPTSQSDR